MEADRVVATLEDGGLEVVVEDPSGLTLEEIEGAHVPFEEGAHALVVEEAHEGHA